MPSEHSREKPKHLLEWQSEENCLACPWFNSPREWSGYIYILKHLENQSRSCVILSLHSRWTGATIFHLIEREKIIYITKYGNFKYLLRIQIILFCRVMLIGKEYVQVLLEINTNIHSHAQVCTWYFYTGIRICILNPSFIYICVCI